MAWPNSFIFFLTTCGTKFECESNVRVREVRVHGGELTTVAEAEVGRAGQINGGGGGGDGGGRTRTSFSEI
jgi:hypothetical protein